MGGTMGEPGPPVCGTAGGVGCGMEACRTGRGGPSALFHFTLPWEYLPIPPDGAADFQLPPQVPLSLDIWAAPGDLPRGGWRLRGEEGSRCGKGKGKGWGKRMGTGRTRKGSILTLVSFAE